mmetsp:Transcript_22407/g.45086  ORF Transcript_22407/g.45086 Transcript_22407/m.45086 type:complete len:229 (-) Transcript_22407:76-762(-)
MQRATHLFGRALRETGQAIDRLGLTFSNNEIYKETFSRHRQVMNLFDKRPIIAGGCFVAPNASVIGNVLLHNECSIWYGAVVRGDKNKIKIGRQTNVQDRAVIGTIANSATGFPAHVDIGDQVTIGHGALITSCTIGNRVLIGQGAIIQEGSDIGNNAIIAAGAVVLPGTVVPAQQLWAGNPAAFIRDVTDAEMEGMVKSAEHYSEMGSTHDAEFLPFGTAYQAAEKN